MVGRQSLGTEVVGSIPTVYTKCKDYLGNTLKVLKAAHLGECSAMELARQNCLFE